MKPITPKQARELAKIDTEDLVRRIPCGRNTWWNAERSEKWPPTQAIRQGAMRVLKCVEVDGAVYLAKDVKGRRNAQSA